ncbi:hypothetical protein BTJ40_06750 [Microbulbifer sp. A4B17]|uniref:hypothetical protein n=1 Tax=Microbulbifer sp. A4B17 TaxID=359370 RepID=UPI000D52ABFA|nr:hypothetical protein [Microbulbifer sp. A4B17]AWF80531.1 hypothetical protein BTJ40_06750 [Microbulbifer sp. A4B17]
MGSDFTKRIKKVFRRWIAASSQGNWISGIIYQNPTKIIGSINTKIGELLPGIIDVKVSKLDYSFDLPNLVKILSPEKYTNKIGYYLNCSSIISIIAKNNLNADQQCITFRTFWNGFVKS